MFQTKLCPSRLEGAGGGGCRSSPKFINVCLLLAPLEAAFPDRPAKIVPAAAEAAQSIFSLYFAVCFPSASISALETTGFEAGAGVYCLGRSPHLSINPLYKVWLLPQRPQTRRVSPQLVPSPDSPSLPLLITSTDNRTRSAAASLTQISLK